MITPDGDIEFSDVLDTLDKELPYFIRASRIYMIDGKRDRFVLFRAFEFNDYELVRAIKFSLSKTIDEQAVTEYERLKAAGL